jgi:hypothetical protein
MTDQRPVHVELVGREVRATPVTDAEWTQMRARDTASDAARAQAETARQADLAAVAALAASEPGIAALVRLVGLVLPSTDAVPAQAVVPAASTPVPAATAPAAPTRVRPGVATATSVKEEADA